MLHIPDPVAAALAESDETIREAKEAAAERKRKRSGAPNKSSDAAIRAFIIEMAHKYPRTVGGRPELFEDPSIPAVTFLARIYFAIDYQPSSLAVLCKPEVYTRKGLTMPPAEMSVPEIANQVSRPMLDEIELLIADREAQLIEREKVEAKEEVLVDTTPGISMTDEEELRTFIPTDAPASGDWGSW